MRTTEAVRHARRSDLESVGFVGRVSLECHGRRTMTMAFRSSNPRYELHDRLGRVLGGAAIGTALLGLIVFRI